MVDPVLICKKIPIFAILELHWLTSCISLGKQMKTNKPLFVSSSNHLSNDLSGNTVLSKPSRINGKPVVLQFVIRSDRDIQKSRHSSYKLLVP
jgi:hypothetical protein